MCKTICFKPSEGLPATSGATLSNELTRGSMSAITTNLILVCNFLIQAYVAEASGSWKKKGAIENEALWNIWKKTSHNLSTNSFRVRYAKGAKTANSLTFAIFSSVTKAGSWEYRTTLNHAVANCYQIVFLQVWTILIKESQNSLKTLFMVSIISSSKTCLSPLNL